MDLVPRDHWSNSPKPDGPSGTLIHQPSPTTIARSQVTAFAKRFGSALNLELPDAASLQEASVIYWRHFWQTFLEDADPPRSGSADPVAVGDDVEDAVFFPRLTLNYAEVLLDPAAGADQDLALIALGPHGAVQRTARGELRHQVLTLAQALAQLGLGAGDQVVAVLRNDAAAVVAALAVAAVGGSLAIAAPDMGAEAILDRFAPLKPRLLIAHVAAREEGRATSLADLVTRIAAAVPSLAALVVLDDGPTPEVGIERHRLSDLLRLTTPLPRWQRFAFNTPLFTMFSSGTSGPPKAIIHGAGGALLEHMKEHRLHCDLRRGERLFFHTSTGWMMWQWQLSALASGATIVLQDGPLDDNRMLWRIVAEHRVSLFGTSPSYLNLSESVGLHPGAEFDLGSLRGILSTGSILHAASYRWVSQHVKDVPLQSISGGTDLLGCFVLGHPNLPVFAGECQTRSLGMDVRSQPLEAGSSIGELICTNPFPSRPLGFHGDADGSRFHTAYFSRTPGCWTHGDLIEFTASGGAKMHGRSDGVLNLRGVRVGPAEVYRVLRSFTAIREALMVEQQGLEGESRAILLLRLAEGAVLDRDLVTRVRTEIRRQTSSAHVPNVILDVPELPVTHGGKLSEAAARDAVNGRPVRNAAALRNPGSIAAIVDHPRLHTGGSDAGSPVDLEQQITALWETAFGFAPISPLDDFFALGGNSLMAAKLLLEVERLTEQYLPLATLLSAPTPRDLVARVEGRSGSEGRQLLRLRAGEGRPVFLIHSLAGTVLEFWALKRALGTERPIYAIEARGVADDSEPQRCIEDIASSYIDIIKTAQRTGPYVLCGFSLGGLIAFEMARQLAKQGETLELLGLIDTGLDQGCLPLRHRLGFRTRQYLQHGRDLLAQRPGAALVNLWSRSAAVFARRRVRGCGELTPEELATIATFPPFLARIRVALGSAMRSYRPGPYPGQVTLFWAAKPRGPDPLPTWRRLALGGLRVLVVDGDHDTMLQNPQVQSLAAALGRCIDEASSQDRYASPSPLAR